MTDQERRNRIAALLMLAAGLTPQDVARHLRVSVQQVRSWMMEGDE